MNKQDFLDALKRAMPGLAPDVQAKTLAYYEQRFVDGVATGRSEEDVGRELDDPGKIAMTLRASSHLQAFGAKRSAADAARVAVSAAGLAIFNLFMVIPALVYSALLFALTVCALAFYLAGVATTAGGLAGTNELVLDWPAHYVQFDDGDANEVRVRIGDRGIVVRREKPEPDAAPAERRPRHAILAEGGRLRVTTDMDADSRTAQILFGVGMVVGGTVLFLLALAVSRYSWLGVKRYLALNLALLKG
jgi:uncharacterized membrane protein